MEEDANVQYLEQKVKQLTKKLQVAEEKACSFDDQKNALQSELNKKLLDYKELDKKYKKLMNGDDVKCERLMVKL